MSWLNRKLTFNKNEVKYPISKYSILGILISLSSVIIATVLTSFLYFDGININGIINAQKTNKLLWFLDFSPIVFAIWGQYAGKKMAYKMSSLLINQTSEFKTGLKNIELGNASKISRDSLTGLPNRLLFRERVEQAIKYANREKSSFCIFILDLKRFKEINYTLGHFAGDLLLNAVALRLMNVVRASDTLARLGGNEYALLSPNIKKFDDISIISRKLMKVFHPAFVLEGMNLEIQACMGAVLYPDHGTDAESLIQRTEIAMNIAKKSSLDLAIYNSEMDRYSPYRLSLTGELKSAIHNDELELYYQPKIDLKTNRLVEVESLVRWAHKKYGIIYPDEFIGRAERTGIIKELTRWVAKNTLNQMMTWHQEGVNIGASINLSAKNLLDKELPEIVEGLLDFFNMPPKHFVIEITETAFMADPNSALEMLTRINNIGVRFSIDDFGTGYSSLSYLTKLPISELKIDKSFVIDMMHNKKNSIIVRTIIEMGHNLGLKVVAEGVETEEALLELRRLGCDIAQGNYISKPLPIEQFNSLIASSAWENSLKS
jgi:diguanylate cyclase